MSQSNHFNSAETGPWFFPIIRLMERNPRKTLILMFVILAISVIAVTVYSVNRKPFVREKAASGRAATLPDISGGIAELWRNGAAVTEAMRIEQEISGLLEKEKLTGADSLDLVKALERLQAIQQKLKPPKK